MPDLIQESYDVLTQFLGETNNKNLKRLPEKYETLLRAVGNLVSYSYRLGKVEGEETVRKEVSKLLKQLEEVPPRYPQYKRLTEDTKNDPS